MVLVDSDILIDVLRGVEPAVNWFDGLGTIPGVPGYVVLELHQGCRNGKEVRDVDALVRPLPVVWPSEEQCERIRQRFSRWWLRNGVSAFDALIAGCAIENNATLLTFNTKHYRAIDDLLLESPYERPPRL